MKFETSLLQFYFNKFDKFKATFLIIYPNAYRLSGEKSFFYYHGEILNGFCSENIHMNLTLVCKRIFSLTDQYLAL